MEGDQRSGGKGLERPDRAGRGLVAGVMAALSQQRLPSGCDMAGSQQHPLPRGGEAFTHQSEPHPFINGSLGES